MSDKNLHWFPGHMQKALREIETKLKIVDVVIELADSRAPLFSTRNQLLRDKIVNKQKLLVLTKLDLADPKKVEEATAILNNDYQKVMAGDLNNKSFIRQIKTEVQRLGIPLHEKQKAKHIKPQPLKVMIIGIPNVGKSTLINKLANRKAAGVENRPGLTKAQQYIRVDQDFILIDTPGVLPPNYENRLAVINLALLGSIRQEILPIHELATLLAEYLIKEYPHLLTERYDASDHDFASPLDLFTAICTRRGLLESGHPSIERAETLLLNEFKNGIIGRISLGEVNDQ